MDKSSINSVYRILEKKIGQPKTELNYRNPYTFLVSVVLSAQATDKSVNAATKDLFKAVKTPKAMVALGERKLKGYIKTIGLYNTKAKNVINLSKILIKDYNSNVPAQFKELINLPGVGNKTASVYQNEILGIPRIAVDTHVYRVSNRVGLVKSKTADQTQEILERITPKKWLKTAHHLLILYGRYTCKSQKPLCDQCVITKYCAYLKNEKDKKNISS
jgi:endonuclease-3|tara:strand:- start:3792 stop:4445 length:654 start_codon:yes stop_codon:yes gene_type:complete